MLHLPIDTMYVKCSAEALHANVIFANAAFHQIGLGLKSAGQATHVFDDRFKVSSLPVNHLQLFAYIISISYQDFVLLRMCI
jgi:hypothetical protein